VNKLDEWKTGLYPHRVVTQHASRIDPSKRTQPVTITATEYTLWLPFPSDKKDEDRS
jgi:hypothetical protein